MPVTEVACDAYTQKGDGVYGADPIMASISFDERKMK